MADVHKDLDTCPSSSGGHGAGVQAKTLRYTFSKETVAEFYGRQFYSITDADNKVVAYSETVFDVPKDISLLGESKTLIFEKSLLVKGEIRGGEIWGGVIWGGVIWGGEIWGGEIWGGEIWGGVIWGGVIWGGVIWGGEIRGGVIRGGVIRGGVIRGGEIRGGEIKGGVIRGGVIRGGVIRGGEIRGGVIEVSLLQIQGTRHFCYASPTKDGKEIHLGIGCEFHSIKEWLNSFGSIGNANDYSESEIEEYGEYIKLFAKRYAPELLKINE